MLLTGSEDVDSELRALDAGADAFVRKEEDFDVILARLNAVLRRAQFDDDEGVSLLGPKRVLVVDDSPNYRGDVADAVRGDGYDVVLAASGEEALAILAAQPVDCILMDLVMPVMDGAQLVQHVRLFPELREVPIVAVTALRATGAARPPVDAVVRKPFEPDELVQVVEHAIAARQGAMAVSS